MDSPSPVALEHEMTDEAWRDYYLTVWNARIVARLNASYWSKMCRWVHGLRTALDFVVVFGSAGTVIALLANANTTAAAAASICVAVAGALLRLLRLAERASLSAELAQGWERRVLFWDDAWGLVLDEQYLGAPNALREGDVALSTLEHRAHLPHFRSWISDMSDTVEQVCLHQASA